MGMMQRRKGASGELEVAKLFEQNGFLARRGGMGQSQGAAIVPDVVVEKLPFLWVEVKRQAQTRPLEAVQQADKALSDGGFKQYKCAVCFTRNNGESWEVWLRVCDLQELKILDNATTLPPTAAVNMPVANFFHLLREKHAINISQPELPIK